MSARSRETVKVRLLFVEDGSWHRETLRLDPALLEGHERLIDALREEPELLKQVYVDVDRLSAAWLVDDDD